MGSDSKAKFLRDAERYVLQGKIPQAITEYLKVVKNDPDDVLTLNTVGDLYLRQGKVNDANRAFSQVAENYARNNFLLKAIAVYKKILNAEPNSLEISLTLATLFSRQGLNVEARNQFLRIADICSKEGKIRESVDAYEKVVELDPMNSAVQLKLAEIYLAEGNKEKAHTYFAAAARAQSKAGDLNAAVNSYRRATQLNPVDVEVMKGFLDSSLQLGDVSLVLDQLKKSLVMVSEDVSLREMLGKAYLASRDPENALKAFKVALAADETRYPLFFAAGKAFLDAGDPDMATTCVETIVPILISRRETDRAVEAYDQILSAHPECVLALTKLATIYSANNEHAKYLETLDRVASYFLSRQSPAEALEYLEKILQVEPDSEKHLKLHREVFEEAFPGRPYVSPAATAAPAVPGFLDPPETPVASGDENMNSAILEADLLVNYGMYDKALGILVALEAQDPLNAATRTRLLSIYKERKEFDKAAEQCLLLSALERKAKDNESAEKYILEAKRLAPEMTGTIDPVKFASQRGIETVPSFGEIPLENAPKESIEVDLSGDLSEIFFKSEPEFQGAPEHDPEPIPEMDATAAEEFTPEATPKPASESIDEQLQEADFYIRLGFNDEARAKLDEIARTHPNHPELSVRYRQLAGGAAESSAPPAEPLPAVQPVVEAAPPGEGDIFAELKIDQAADLVLEDYSSKPETGKRDEPMMAVASAGSTAVEGAAPAASGQKGQVNSMFADLIDEVNSLTDHEIAREEFETHFSLGIAYREMNLVEDAIKEFQGAVKAMTSARNPREVVQCCGMLSTCFLEKGMPRSAIRWCQTGLGVSEISPHESLALRYDMGVAHSNIGDFDRALECFGSIFGIDPAYRDVAQRIDEIRGGAGPHVP